MIVTMVYLHPILLISEALILFVICFFYLSYKQIGRFLKLSVWMGIAIIMLNVLFNQNGSIVLWTIFSRSFTLEALVAGGLYFLSYLCLLLLFILLNQMLGSAKLLLLGAKRLPQFTLLLLISLRFLKLFTSRMKQIQAVQTVQGVSVATGSLKARLHNGGLLVKALLVSSLEEALVSADSMSARGYGLKKRTHYQHYLISRRDVVLASLMLVVTIGLCYFQEQGQFTLYPLTSPLAVSWLGVLLFSVSGLLVALPIIIEGMDRLWWFFHK